MARSQRGTVAAALLSLASLLAACGSDDVATQRTAVSGTVFAGPVTGASVVVRTAAGDQVGGPVTTAAGGAFTVDVETSALSGDLRFEATGGSHVDEATGTTVTTGLRLAAWVPAGSLSGGAAVHLTPGSTIVHDEVQVVGLALEKANANFYAGFGYTPDTTVAPRAEAPASATLAQRQAAQRAAAFSFLTHQYFASDPEKQPALLAAVAQDLGNGYLDQKDAAGAVVEIETGVPVPLSLQYDYSTALNAAGAAAPELGLTPTKVQTDGLAFEMVPGPAGLAMGRSTFQVKVSHADGTPATGLALTLTPTMFMAVKYHSAPREPVVESSTPGTYDCTVYFQMGASSTGATAGYWALAVAADGDTATFYPAVAMAPMTAPTPLARLYGVADTIPSMTGTPAKRTYLIFNDGLSGAGPQSLDLFVAAPDDAAMTQFPPVGEGTVLHGASGAAWTVGAVVVEASSDEGATWRTAVPGVTGHYRVDGLAAVAPNGKVRVRISVDGEAKTNQAATQDYTELVFQTVSPRAAVGGSAFAGPVEGALVTVRNAAGQLLAGPVPTGADGAYALALDPAALAGDLRFEAAGGSYLDEATGGTVASGVRLAAYVAGGTLASGGQVHLTPGSTVVHDEVVSVGLTLAKAGSNFYAGFGYTPDTAVAPRAEAPATATFAQRTAALRAGAFSRLTHAYYPAGPEKLFALLPAIARDLGNGYLDTKDATGATVEVEPGAAIPLSLQYDYNAAQNAQGTAAPVLEISPTRVVTDGRVFEFPAAAGLKMGRSEFQVKVSEPGGAPAGGLTVSVTPTMFMAVKYHSAPVEPAVESATAGAYDCAVYFQMGASSTGATAGFWALAVSDGTDTATFYPPVAMAPMTAPTPLARLYGVADTIPSMTGTPQKRTYLIFNDGLTATGPGAWALDLFVAAPDDAAMTQFPAIGVGTQLHDAAGAAWTVSAVAVTASSDGGTTWRTAVAGAPGHYRVEGLGALAAAPANKVMVKVSVDGEQKANQAATQDWADLVFPQGSPP